MDNSTQNQLRYEGIQDTDSDHIEWSHIIEAALNELHELQRNS
jgi:hypothetical protein